MKINITKGLFRLWIVGSVVFVICTYLSFYSEIRDDFRRAQEFDWSTAQAVKPLPPNVPPPPSGYTYVGKMPAAGGNTDKPQEIEIDPNSIRPLTSAPDPFALHPWINVAIVSALAFGVPLTVLVLGWALLWAFSGFRTTSMLEN